MLHSPGHYLGRQILHLLAVLLITSGACLEAAVASSASASLVLDENLVSGGSSASASASLDGDLVMVQHLRAASNGSQVGFLGGVASVVPLGNNTPVVSATTVTTTTAIALAISATDADGDALIYAVGTPSSGVVSTVDQALGTFIWTPSAGFVGTATIPVTAGDGWVLGSGTVTVQVVVPMVIVSPAGPLTVREDGGQAAVTVRLNAPPTATATIPIQSSNPSGCTASAASLVFTTTNWNQPQAIVVTGVHDMQVTGDRSVTLQLLSITGGGNFAGVKPADVTVTVIDIDKAGFSAAPTSIVVSKTGTTAVLTVRLGTPPSAPVTISALSSATSKAMISPLFQTVVPAAWNTPLIFTVTGVNDFILDGNQPFTISFTSSGDAAYTSLPPVLVNGLCLDSNAKALLINQGTTTLQVAEGSSTPATWTVFLSQVPTAPVTVTLTPDAYLTVSPLTLTFTPQNWATPQTVLARAVDDLIAQGTHQGTVTHIWSSADAGYVSGSSGVVVTAAVIDNDTAGIFATPTAGLRTNQTGATATFTVTLASQPTALVTVPLTSTALTQGQVSPSSLSFNATTWNVPQTVTITGADSGRYEGDVGYQVLVGNAVSTDSMYQGLTGGPVLVTNQSVDFPPTIDPLIDRIVAEDSGQLVITLSGISVGHPGENQVAVVTASSVNPGLTGPLQVVYASPGTTGAISLTPLPNANGSATITITVADGVQTLSRTFTLTVTPVNDPPVIVRTTPLVVAYHGSSLLLPLQVSPTTAGQFAVADVETPAASLLIRVVSRPNFGDLELINLQSGTTTTLGNGSVVTAADVAAGLVRYLHIDPSSTPATSDAVQLQVDDGTGGTAAGTLTISIDTSVPRIDLALLPLAYTEGGTAVYVGATAQAFAGTSSSFDGGTLMISGDSGTGPGDRLTLVPTGTGPGQIDVAGTQLSYGGIIFATVGGGTAGAPLVVSFSGPTSAAMVQAVVRTVTFDNSGQNPGSANRILTCVVTDAAAKTSPVAQRTVVVTTVNDPPTATGPAILSVAGRLVSGAITGIDPEGAPLTYALATLPSKGTVTAFDALSGAFTYQSGQQQSGNDVFTVTVSDGQMISLPATVQIDITGPGTLARPWLYSRPPMVAQAGSLLQWTALVDASDLNSPSLEWSLSAAPSGMTLVVNGSGLDAGLSWPIPAGAAGWFRFTVVVIDHVSRTTAVQDQALFIEAMPGGGG